MRRRIDALRRFMSQDRALTLFLVLLVGVVFVTGPLGVIGQIGQTVLAALFSLMLVVGITTVPHRPAATLAAAAIAVAAIVVDWVAVWHPTRAVMAANALSAFAYLGALTAVVLARVFDGGPITVHRVVGAVAAYVLLGLLWSLLYQALTLLLPGAFRNAADPGMRLFRSDLLYFSFVSLTTVGYGDVVAVHPMARSLAMLENLTGQLYPAILIARLVSLEIASRPRR